MGFLDFLGPIASGVTALTGIGSLISGSSAASANREAQLEVQKRDQDFQREMWEKSNKYNSPFNQARLMAQGGFSPSALFDHGGSTVSQATTPTAGSHSFQPFMSAQEQNPLLLFGTLAQSIEALARAKKVGAETKTMETLLNDTLKGIQLDNNIKELNRNIINAYGEKEASIRVAEAIQRIAQLKSETEFKNEQAKSETIKQTGYAIDNLIKQVEKDLKGNELEQIKIYLETYRERTLAELNNIKAKTTESRSAAVRNYSQANLFDEMSVTESQMRQGRIRALDLSNDLQDISRQMSSRENVRDAATHTDKIHAIVSQCEAQSFINEKMAREIEHQITENDWQSVQYALGCMGQAVGMVTSVGNLQLNELTTTQRLDIQREFNRIYEQGQSRSQTNYAPDGHGNWRPVWRSVSRTR